MTIRILIAWLFGLVVSVQTLAAVAPSSTPAGAIKLSPKVRILVHQANPDKIPKETINNYLERVSLLSHKAYGDAPTIVAMEKLKVMAAEGDKIYVRGFDNIQGEQFNVVGLAEPIHNDKDEIVGYKAFIKGTARLIEPGPLAIFEITKTHQEVKLNDKLVAAPALLSQDVLPQRVKQPINSQILAVFGGVSHIAAGHLVVLPVGQSDGLAVGNLLGVYRSEKSIQGEPLPKAFAGQLVLLKLLEHMSLAVMLDTNQFVQLRDVVSNY